MQLDIFVNELLLNKLLYRFSKIFSSYVKISLSKFLIRFIN